jgi:hypothetical protein
MTFPHSTISYFAVQLKAKFDSPHEVTSAFLRHADEAGVSFKQLDCMDTITVGATMFVRYRADLINPWTVLDRLHGDGRAVIGPGLAGAAGQGYLVKMAGGRVGAMPFSTLQSVPRALRTYRGTAQEHWQRQFGAPTV